jgi:iron complex outermembrane receptor protein
MPSGHERFLAQVQVPVKSEVQEPWWRTPGNRIQRLAAVGLLAAAAAASHAQTLEEIIVTAQKRAQRLQEVPISVTAFSGDDLELLGFGAPFDLFKQTPNVTLVGDTVFPQVNIRGVQAYDFGAGNEPPVGFYFDEVYLGTSSSQQGQLFDIERAEVLRGPQGTLFGRNTTGGLVHYISRKPTEEFEGRGRFQYGSYDQTIVEGAVSGPLGDRVRGRLAFKRNNDDGWQVNKVTGTDFMVTDVFAGRGLLEIDLIEEATLLLNVHGSTQDNRSDGFAVLGTLDPATGMRCPPGRILAGDCVTLSGFRHGNPEPTDVFSNLDRLEHSIDSFGASGTLHWNINGTEMVAISAYEWSDRVYEEDADGPDPLLDAFFTVEAEQFTQELRLSGETGRLQWLMGGFYYNDAKEDLGITVPPLIELVGSTLGLQNEATLDTESWAVFGHGEYALGDRFSLVAGLRFTAESRDLVITDSFAAPSFVDTEEADADKVTWKAGLNWQVSDETLAYASVTSGFKSSAFNTILVTPGQAAPVGEEENVNYEIGVKTDALMGGRLRFNAAAFYNDYREFQVVTHEEPGGIPAVVFLNGGDLELYGADFELELAAAENLMLGLGVGLLEGEIDAPPTVAVRGIPLDGKEPPHAPSVSLNALARYFVPLAEHGALMLQMSVTWEDDVFFEANNDPTLTEDDNLIWDARVRWTSPAERYFVEGFVDNILDEELVYGGFDISSLGFITLIWQPPRRAGVTVGLEF